MKLYFSPGACSLAPHIALCEAGLKFESLRVDLKTKIIAGGADFKKVNPKGYVPTLELNNGDVLTECSVLLQYIADQAPEKNLAPKFGTPERYKLMETLNYIATEIHKGFSPLWSSETPDAYKKVATEKLMTRLEYVNETFKKNTFLMGNQFTVADAYLFNVVSWAKPLKMDLSKFTNLLGYMEKVGQRPAVREAMKAEGLIK